MTLKTLRVFLFDQYSFLANFSNDLDKFSRLKPDKEKTGDKKTCIIQLHNYIITC